MTWLKGCDFSWDKPDLKQLWAAGYRVILVYMSTSSKGVSASYVKAALDQGFKILPLYETSAGAALGGYSTGVSHAKTATSIAKSLGCPPGVPIIYALDQDFNSSQLAGPISEYVRGLHAVTGPDAVYGGYNQVNYLVRHGAPVKQNFQTYAWSGGKWLPTSVAPIEQYHNGVKVAGGTVDDCRVQDNLIFWEKEMPLTKEDGVTVFNTDIIPNPSFRKDSPKHDPAGTNPNTKASFALGDMWQRIGDLQSAVAELKAAQAAPVVNTPTAAEIAAEIIKQLGGTTSG